MHNVNNFDLIRLLAAMQVAVHHSLVHLSVDHSFILKLTGLFPGVPIFFFISGFLISKSFERNPHLLDYVSNRILRIYPGLIACFLVSISSVYLLGYFKEAEVSVFQFFRWTVAQLTIGQFFNPDFMRQYGVGVLNGSLWTITVELQFYVVVPVIYMLLHSRGVLGVISSRLLIALLLVFVLANQLYVFGGIGLSELFLYKLLGVSFLPWLYMFLLGVLFQRNFEIFHKWLAGKFMALFLSYVVLAFIARDLLGWGFGNTLNPVIFIALSVVIFSAAFSYQQCSDRILQRNDISYGVYIYHMPVVNCLVTVGITETNSALFAALFFTVLMAYISWRVVEKPVLRFKRHPLYQHYIAAVPDGCGTNIRENKKRG